MRIMCSCFIYVQRLQQAIDTSIKGSYWKKDFRIVGLLLHGSTRKLPVLYYGRQHTGNTNL
jgi:hypothetical protein